MVFSFSVNNIETTLQHLDFAIQMMIDVNLKKVFKLVLDYNSQYFMNLLIVWKILLVRVRKFVEKSVENMITDIRVQKT